MLRKIKQFGNLEVDRSIKILIIIGIFVLMGGDVLLIKNIYVNKYGHQEKKNLTYWLNSNVDYNVSLMNNDLFSEKLLGPNRMYITSLVDKLNTLNTFNFKIDKNSQFDGNYSVSAELKATLPEDEKARVVWEKNYTLIENEKFKEDADITITNNTLSFKKNLTVNIKEYLNFINNVNRKYDMNYSTVLNLLWSIDVLAESAGKTITKYIRHNMEIPIDEKQMQVNGNLNYNDHHSIKTKIKYIKTNFYWNSGVAVTVLIGLLLLLGYVILFVKIKNGAIDFNKDFNKIKRLYGERIVSIVAPLNYQDKKNIIEVADIEDLVKIADDLSKPVLFNNFNNHPGAKEMHFYIINYDELYVYNYKNK